jgi:DNA repair protein RadA/Sms
MSERGLETVEDPSHELLRDRAANVPGSAVTCLIEGQRPLLLELQALVSHAGYGTPTRRATGVDSGRLGMLLAVLARRAGVNALEKDVYANAVGGIDARDQSVDLAVTAAIASATKDKTIPSTTAFFGEVGLAGELRPVGLPEARVKELARLGFTHIIAPGLDKMKAPKDVTLISAKTLREALEKAGIL